MMDDGREYRWRIDAYTPDTMPLGRLAAYLVELAAMLGENNAVHLVGLEPGSTVLVHKVDTEAAPKIRERTEAVARGDAPVAAMRHYANLNKMLLDDNASAALLEEGAEILEFPGKKIEWPRFPSITERGEIVGEVLRVGGVGDPVPVMLATESGSAMSGCWARRPVAKLLGGKLFEPVRLFGEGRWSRTSDGRWLLNAFRIDSFEEIAKESLSEALIKLRAVPGLDWGDDIVDELLSLRADGGANGGL